VVRIAFQSRGRDVEPELQADGRIRAPSHKMYWTSPYRIWDVAIANIGCFHPERGITQLRAGRLQGLLRRAVNIKKRDELVWGLPFGPSRNNRAGDYAPMEVVDG
jgi:hypothetical protein